MDRLEAVEVRLSELEMTKRIDAEYYRKSFLKWENMILCRNHVNLSTIANFLIGPFGSSYDTSNYVEQSDYRYVRGQDVKPFLLMDSDSRYVDKSDFERLSKYTLKENDILVSVVGTLGNACIIRKKDVPAIFSCKSTVVRIKKQNAHYLIAYLNSKYGRELLLRKERGAIQKGLNLDDLRLLQIPIFSDIFEKNIESYIIQANNVLDNAKSAYTIAQNLLLSELELIDYTPTNKSVSIKTFAESFGSSGRLDAEYYQPKYSDIEYKIKNYKNGFTLIDDVFFQNKEIYKSKKKEHYYIEISDVDISSGTATYNKLSTENLPANAKIKLNSGDLIYSTVRPYRGAVAICEFDKYIVVSGAFTVLHQKSDYLIETLFVILRSNIYQEYIMKYNVGSSYPVVKDDDVLNLKIPNLPNNVQQQIAEKVRKSFELRKKSAALLEYAKQAVEMAIEQGEDVALKWVEEITDEHTET